MVSFSQLLSSLCVLSILVSTSTSLDGAEPTIQTIHGKSHRLAYLGKTKIPNIKIDGTIARIHTQGIYVTDNSIYVTGRLEREPKRALFLRFDRSNLSQFEYLDITPNQKTQDHPGGFDYDGQAFWIPIAVSKPHSTTSVYQITTRLDRPLSEATPQLAFLVDDHIGAIAVNATSKQITGANWDTKAIYRWQYDGILLSQTPREQLIKNNMHWALAVQDWKFLPSNQIVASGYDKSSTRKAHEPKTTIDWLDLGQRRLVDRIRLTDPHQRESLTREGMTIHNNELYLLPGDLGEDAVLYQYRVEKFIDK